MLSRDIRKGLPLMTIFRPAEETHKLNAIALGLPLFMIVIMIALLPRLVATLEDVINENGGGQLHHTAQALADWDGKSVPSEGAFAALAEDIQVAQAGQFLNSMAKHINYGFPGAAAKFSAIALKIKDAPSGPYKELFLMTDSSWSDPRLWRVIRGANRQDTPYFWLTAVDSGRALS